MKRDEAMLEAEKACNSLDRGLKIENDRWAARHVWHLNSGYILYFSNGF